MSIETLNAVKEAVDGELIEPFSSTAVASITASRKEVANG